MTDDLRDRVTLVEGEMQTMEARNEALKSDVRAALSDMRADMVANLSELRAEVTGNLSDVKADFSQLREELAKRDEDNNRWTIGLAVAAVIVIIAGLGFMIETGS